MQTFAVVKGLALALLPLALAADDNTTVAGELTVRAGPFAEPVWVDLVTGDAYAIPAANVRTVGETTVYRVPVYDSPVFVTDRRLLDLDRSWYVESLNP